ncbi:LCP family protein [Nonomuraea sp. NPDC049695]|uniref:LCP family protein n=1 Tax=Nonomuraea sp. NPDC049695 TaxID=3154734 RepID=UPI00342EE6FF
MTENRRGFGLGASMALTLASALLWGVAHLAAERLKTGLALMFGYVVMLAGILTMFTAYSANLLSLAVQPRWLVGLTVALVVVALAWTGVIVWSFLLVRPPSADTVGRFLTTTLTAALCALVLAPTVYAARLTYLSRDVVNTLFAPAASTPVMAHDPWNGARRVNFLLLGGDAAPSRPGVRTDSMTVASVDTETGATVLFGLPRNLQRIEFPDGPARARFPFGFTGSGPETPGLLNEVYQFAEDNPDMVPGVPKGKRGSTLLKQTIGNILGIDVDYYALVDMKGFAEIIDAMGGVKVTIKEPIVYGKYREGLLPTGTRRLSGEEALWYGRSRTDSDDYVRMGRQKCLLNAVAKQAEPMTVLNSFERLAVATKRAISTDLPQEVLPAVVDLSQKVKDAKVRSLSFVPPLINTAYPDWSLIRRKVADALEEHPSAGHSARTQDLDSPVNLDATCA